jgi:TonB family protein
MRVRFIVLVFVLSFNLAFADENLADIKTVISEGVGTDPQSAAQNAAENALKNVVGSFMDTNTLLEKRTIINDGIQSQAKNISKDIKEYSQGSIKSFEIIDTKNEGGLFKLTAKVAIRNENFSVYIKKIAQGETKIDGTGMFAQVATKTSQESNLINILTENVIEPIFKGEVQRFEIQKPVLLNSLLENSEREQLRKLIGHNGPLIRGDNATGTIFFPGNTDNIIVFQVTTLLNESFVENMTKTLTSIANKHTVADIKSIPPECYTQNNDGFCIIKRKNQNSIVADIFVFKNGQKINSHLQKIIPENNMKLTIIDANGTEILIKKMEHGVLNNRANHIGYSSDFGIFPVREMMMSGYTPIWTLMKKESPSLITEQYSFYIWIDVNTEILKKADKIVITLGEYSNSNTISSESNSQPTEDKKKIDNSTSEISKSKSTENLKNTEKLENNLKPETPKSEKSTKQLQELKTKAVANIKQKINSGWDNSVKNADFSLLNPELVSKFKCVVVATLSADGTVTDVALKESSGYGGFDSIAESAVKKSSPLPIVKDDDLFENSFKNITFIFDKNNIEIH